MNSYNDAYYLTHTWPSKEYFYSLALSLCLNDNAQVNIDPILRYIDTEFSFDPNHFCFILTGIKKSIYRGVFNLSVNDYMSVYSHLKDMLSAVLFAQNWNGDLFLIFNTNEKQIAIIASPSSDARCTAEELADIISRLVQQTYEREIFKGNTRFCNVTSLVGPASGFEAIRESYHTARMLNDLSFFHMNVQVLSENYIAQNRNTADYPTILDACFALRSYIDEGNTQQAECHLKRLFLETIRGSFSLALCDDALSFIKSMLQVRCRVYNIVSESSLETLCARTSYHKVEECVDTLIPIIRLLCAAVQKQGAFSKPVLSAIYYIKMHFSEYLVLTDIAHYANTNASYLSSRFKEETGYSVRNYINKVRLENAQNILLKNQDTLSVIAQQVGFEDVRYFTRLFKQFSGCTPTEYRRSSAQSLYIKDED